MNDEVERDAARWRELVQLEGLSVDYYGLPCGWLQKKIYGGSWQCDLNADEITNVVDERIARKAAVSASVETKA